MLFNSYEYIFLFLPVTFLVYFTLNHKKLIMPAKLWLVFSSLFFYSWWNIIYLPLILISIIFNYIVGSCFNKKPHVFSNYRKHLLIFGIIGNISLLAYFKYADFFITNFNFVFKTDLNLLQLVLPLAISFFTFQQIAFLVDSYRKETQEYDFLSYSVFVSFFPQLIAGPIVHHREMMPQFRDQKNLKINYKNIAIGLFVFFIGLSKKVLIADTFAVVAIKGFDHAETLRFFEAWATSLSYTFQLYFDFSGYTDMAIGAALLFNIKLPINFNSPYKAVNIQDFWRRWHITLSRFLRNYIYIPLGGSRSRKNKIYFNIIITFLIGGIWHGAGWTFVFWGMLHGLASIVHRLWKQLGLSMHPMIGWFLTFNFVNIAWVFFRADQWQDALKVLKGMTGTNGVSLPIVLTSKLSFFEHYDFITFGGFLKNIGGEWGIFLLLPIMLSIVLLLKNSVELRDNFKPNLSYAIWGSLVTIISVLSLNKISEFLYFNF